MAIVTVSGHAKIMGQREVEHAPKAFKLWEKAIFEKRDGTIFEKNILWLCWFDAPQDLVLNSMNGETWVEVRGQIATRIGEYTKPDGETIKVIEYHLNKCEIIQKKEPTADLHTWDEKTPDEAADAAKRLAKWDTALAADAPF